MNYCNTCEYLCYPEYESNYSECMIFGEEPPEEYATEDGCSCTKEKLKEIHDANERARLKDMECFVDWFLKNKSEEK